MLVRVGCPEGVLHLRVRLDTGGPAWARVGPHAIDHLERAAGWSARLREAARRLGARTPSVQLALAEAFVGCALEVLPTLPPGVVPPRWPLGLRTGGPGAPWPFDPELAALELGLRRAIKREAFDEREARADVEWLEGHGLIVRRVGPVDRDGRRALLAARAPAHLDVLQRLELAAQRGEADAVEELGAWLGYPACCASAFAALGPRDDGLSFAIRLRDPRQGPLPAELLFLGSALALVSHLPCDASCPRTLAQARAVRDLLDGSGFVDAWLALAARVHVVDGEGRALALDADDEPGGLRVRDAVELSERGARGGRPVLPRPDLAHQRLAWRGRTLVGDGPEGLEGLLVADHRVGVGSVTT